jgi:hypothetical protein
MFPLVSLFTLALLTLFSLNLTAGSRHNLELTELSLARTQARYLAESGLACAMAVLASDTTRTIDSSGEPWSESPGSFRDRKLTSGRFSAYHWEDSGGWGLDSAARDTAFGLVDEESKLNVLMTPIEVLGRLPDFPQTLLWVIGNRQSSHDWSATGQPVERRPSLAELVAEAGLNRDVTDRLSRSLTTHGTGEININTVSSEILGVLGVSAALRNKIMSFREGEDQVVGTEDDGVFTDPAGIAATLGEAVSLSAQEAGEVSRLESSGWMVVYSRHFRVMVTGFASPGPGRVTIEAVVHRPASGPPVIVEWFES